MSSTILPQIVICLLNRKEGKWSWDFNALVGSIVFSSAVSGSCQVFIVTRGLRPKVCRPSANTENYRRMREKPLVPRVALGNEPAVNS